MQVETVTYTHKVRGKDLGGKKCRIVPSKTPKRWTMDVVIAVLMDEETGEEKQFTASRGSIRRLKKDFTLEVETNAES